MAFVIRRSKKSLLATSAEAYYNDIVTSQRKGMHVLVGKNIKKFRESQKLTQDDLASKLHVTRQAISSWETEKTQPDIDSLQKIAEALGVSVEEIVYGTKRETTTIVNNNTVEHVTKGLTFGAALAMIISYVKWQSIGWAILHGLLNWIYVMYYIIKYGWS